MISVKVKRFVRPLDCYRGKCRTSRTDSFQFATQFFGALDWFAVNGVAHGNIDPSHVLLKQTKPLVRDGSSFSRNDQLQIVGFGHARMGGEPL